MCAEIEFDPTLYRGTARYYDRFRVGYPQALIDHIVNLVGPSGRGRLLDLACGTGQVAFALAARFAEVWAVDQEPDMIEVVRDKAQAAGTDHVRALVARVEDLDAPPSAFELVTIGTAFHRLAREPVAINAYRWSQPGTHIGLLWSTPPWSGDADWQRALSAVLERWKMRVGERVPRAWDQARRERPDLDVLTAAGFDEVSSARFPTAHEWTVDALIGFAYSTSFLPAPALGTHAKAFEGDVRSELDNHTLRQTIDFACEVARRPM